MRKSSKLLAVLLTLCLLFGAITAIFASASGEATNPYDVTGHSANAYKAETKTHYYINDNSAPTYDSSREIKNLGAITLDFDIAFTGNPVAADAGKCSIGNVLNYYDEAGTSKGAKTGGRLYIYWNNGNPGIGSTTGIASNGALAYDANAAEGEEMYSHVTVVMAPKVLGIGYNLTQSVYINGKQSGYSIAPVPTNTASNALGVNAMYNGFDFKDVKAGTIVIKNIAVNHYTGTELAAYTSNQSKANICDAEKVVYNASYVRPNQTEEDICATLSTGEKFYNASGPAIGRKITDGATLTIDGVNLTNVDVPVGVGSFTVKCENGATFALSDASNVRFAKNGDVYTKKQIVTSEDFTPDKTGTVNIGSRSNDGKDVKTSAVTTLGWAYNNSAKSPYINATYVDNAYTRIHYQAGALKDALDGKATINYQEREAEVAWRAYSKYNEQYELSNMKYMTLDFDFGADAYAYTFTVGDKTYYATAMTEAEAVEKVNAEWGANTLTAGNYTLTNCDLAFPTSEDGTLALRLQFVVSDKEVALTVSSITTSSNYYWHWDATTVYVTKSDGAWHLTSGDNKALLSNEVGVFDHLTFVCEVTQVGDNTVIVPHVYVNGDYAFDAPSTNGKFTDSYDDTKAGLYGDDQVHDATYHMFEQLMVDFGKDLRTSAEKKSGAAQTLDTPAYKMYDRYSIAFDNMTITYYDEVDLAGTTLDESMEEKTPLYALDGVVYDYSYKPYGQEGYITVDGKDFNNRYAAFYNAEGKTLYLNNIKLKDFVTDLNSFTIVKDEKSDFNLDPAKCWGYYEKNGTYKKVIGSNDIQASMTLYNGEVALVFYVPAKDGLSIGTGHYSTFKLGTKTVNGVSYLTYTWTPHVYNLTEYTTKFVLNYQDGDDVYTLTSSDTKFGMLKYATKAAEIYECGSEEAVLIKAIVDYKYQTGIFMDGPYSSEVVTKINAFNAIYEAHGKACKCATATPEGNYINVGAEHTDKKATKIVRFAASGNQFGLFVDATAGAKVTLSYKSVTALLDGKTTTTSLTVAGDGTSVAFTKILATDIDNEFTITISEEGEEDKVYVFSLVDYIAAWEAVKETDANYETAQKVLPVVKALANYAVAAENYKVYVK